MKVIKLRCPSCGANLTTDSSRMFMFCPYCGSPLSLNGNFTSEVRTKRPHRFWKTALLIFIFLIFILLLVSSVERTLRRGRLVRTENEKLATELYQPVSKLCRQSGCSLVNVDGQYGPDIDIRIDVDTFEKEPVHDFAGKIGEFLNEYPGQGFSVSLDCEGWTVMYLDKEENGSTRTFTDNTNQISDEEASRLIVQYKKAFDEAELPFDEKDMCYSADTLYLSLKYKKVSHDTVDRAVRALQEINKKLQNVKMSFRIYDDNYSSRYTADLNENNALHNVYDTIEDD